jgi:O-antigen ligase
MMHRPKSEFPVAMVSSIQLWTTLVVLVLAPLCFGSVDLFWIAVWVILLSISAMCGVAADMGTAQRRVLLAFLAICGLYGLIGIIQIIPNDAFRQLNDPIWLRAGEVLGIDMLSRISSRAEIPSIAVGHLLLFATSFVNGFCLGTSRRDCEKLISFARYSILLYAIYGLFALSLTPNMLLWTEKVAYRGSLTATFVNHNTAATLLGTGLILWLCETIRVIQVRLSSIRVFLMSRSNEALALKIIGHLTATFLCLFALVQTGSRGGLICSSMGLLAAAILMVANKWKLQRRYAAFFAVAAFGLTVALVSRLGRIASQGLIDEGRLSVYGLSWQAIKERPLLGAGIGTFPDLFPAFRSSDLWTWGVWDYAHSTILEIAFEMGVPVAVLIAAGAVASVYILLRAAARSAPTDRAITAPIAGIAILGYSHSMIDFSLQIPGYLIVFGILLGCGLARALSAKKPKRLRNAFAVTEPTSERKPVLS